MIAGRFHRGIASFGYDMVADKCQQFEIGRSSSPAVRHIAGG
jgi:hypothetical protein